MPHLLSFSPCRRICGRHPSAIYPGNHRPVAVPHLCGHPHRMLSGGQHHGCVGVPGLVRTTVAHAGLLQRVNPQSFPDRSVAGPSLSSPRVLEDFLVGQVSEFLLRLQGFQRRAEQLDAAQGINIGPSCSYQRSRKTQLTASTTLCMTSAGRTLRSEPRPLPHHPWETAR